MITVGSQSARKSRKFVYGSCNELNVIFYLRDLFSPSDCNSVNEVSNARLDLFQENVKKA